MLGWSALDDIETSSASSTCANYVAPGFLRRGVRAAPGQPGPTKPRHETKASSASEAAADRACGGAWRSGGFAAGVVPLRDVPSWPQGIAEWTQPRGGASSSFCSRSSRCDRGFVFARARWYKRKKLAFSLRLRFTLLSRTPAARGRRAPSRGGNLASASLSKGAPSAVEVTEPQDPGIDPGLGAPEPSSVTGSPVWPSAQHHPDATMPPQTVVVGCPVATRAQLGETLRQQRLPDGSKRLMFVRGHSRIHELVSAIHTEQPHSLLGELVPLEQEARFA